MPKPKAWGVVYAEPNPNGSRKRCENCIMWTRAEGGRCVIHARSLRIRAEDVCGYHVFGVPLKKWMDHPGIKPVNPVYSGLTTDVGKGTSCDWCKWYDRKDERHGLCQVVDQEGSTKSQPVLAMACCAAWEPRDKMKGGY